VLPALVACAPRPPAPERIDLLEGFHEVETRSDVVDLDFLVRDPSLAHEGFVAEKGTLWSRRPDATLVLPFATTAAKTLRLSVRVHEALGPRLPAELSLNGHQLAAVELTPEERELELALPESVQQPGPNALRLAIPRVFKQAAGATRRPRGVAISALEVGRADSTQRASPPAREADRLWLPPPSSVAFDVRVPSDAVLELAAEAASSRPARLRVRVGEREADRDIAELALRPGVLARRTVRIAAPSGGFLRIEVVNPGDAPARLAGVRLLRPVPAMPPAAVLAGRPNLIVFLVDTLRADHLGAYGHAAPTSPRFDAFAREAVLFRDAWAQSSWTRPTVASLFTGLAPDAHGISGVSGVLVDELTTLAEALAKGGYRTGAFVANHVVARRFGFAQGFEAWNEGDEAGLFGKPAAVLAERALRWVDTASRPFFLYVHTLEPHAPYAPEAEHWAPFLFEDYRGSRNAEALAHKKPLTPDELRFLRSAYEGEVRQNDAAFGMVLDGLRARGLLEASLVLFVADHGEEFRDHGAGGHGRTLYQEVVRVPLAVRLPAGARGGTAEGRPVDQVDLMPTLLALLGRPVPAEVHGRDLSSLWLGREPGEGEQPLQLSRLLFDGRDKVAVRAGRLKLILNHDAAPPGGRVPTELYDLVADPAEGADLAAARPVVVRALRAEAARLLAAHAAARERLRAGREIELSAEERERLRALGYLQ
jgi:arylsulfatase A-like enzyme